MANIESEESQIEALLALSQEQLETQLAVLVAENEELLAVLELPQTEPPIPAKDVFRIALKPSQRIEYVKTAFNNRLAALTAQLRQRICIDLDYCNRKGHELLKLLKDIIGLLISLGVITWHPKLWPFVATLAVYLYRNGYFDNLCKCPKK